MSKATSLNVVALMKVFPDHETARDYLEQRRWPHGPECPGCGSVDIYTRKGKRVGMYDCRACGKHFSVRSGTVLERSHVKLHIWLYAIYTVVTHNHISAMQLSKEIGVQYKTAWFLLQRIRESYIPRGEDCAMHGSKRTGVNYTSDRESCKHEKKEIGIGQSSVGKRSALKLRERDSADAAILFVDCQSRNEIHPKTHECAVLRSTFYSDEHRSYGGLGIHGHLNHSEKDCFNTVVPTSSVKSICASLKGRGTDRNFQRMSEENLGIYVDECGSHLNEERYPSDTLRRLDNVHGNAVLSMLKNAELVQ